MRDDISGIWTDPDLRRTTKGRNCFGADDRISGALGRGPRAKLPQPRSLADALLEVLRTKR